MIYLYDHTFEGFLSAVFKLYEDRALQAEILPFDSYRQENIFEKPTNVIYLKDHTDRVIEGLLKYTSKDIVNRLYRCWLSENENIERLILDFIRYIFKAKKDISTDYSHDAVLSLKQIDKQIGREVHRMHAFVRFEHTQDDWYVASIQPDFNVIPLIGDHFRNRYADQKWIIYDSFRHTAVYYDLDEMNFAEMNFTRVNKHGQINKAIYSPEEHRFQQLWKTYFDSVNIAERKNTKLHIRHVPKRYWKLLSEKQPSNNVNPTLHGSRVIKST